MRSVSVFNWIFNLSWGTGTQCCWINMFIRHCVLGVFLSSTVQGWLWTSVAPKQVNFWGPCLAVDSKISVEQDMVRPSDKLATLPGCSLPCPKVAGIDSSTPANQVRIKRWWKMDRWIFFPFSFPPKNYSISKKTKLYDSLQTLNPYEELAKSFSSLYFLVLDGIPAHPKCQYLFSMTWIFHIPQQRC